MAYRNKTYVCFDGDTDMHYYRLMCAWKQDDGTNFNFYNAHDLNNARDTSQEESIKRQLRERLLNTKIFVVLVGERTQYLFRFVRWEMEQAINMSLPIIAVNLNGCRRQDIDRCPPIIRDKLAIHVSFQVKIIQYAFENWPKSHADFGEGQSGAFYYKDETYKELGL